MNRSRLTFGVLLLFPLFIACGDDPPPRAVAKGGPRAEASPSSPSGPTAAEAEAALAAEAGAKKAESESAAKDEVEVEYVYNPIGKRDPFRSPFTDVVVIETEIGTKGAKVKGPLQRWGVEQLALRATITGTGSPMAMLIDPEGVGHVVRRGALVGKNWGKVTAIRRDCIVITEQLRDTSGAVTAVKSQRCLPKTDRERKMEKQLAKGT